MTPQVLTRKHKPGSFYIDYAKAHRRRRRGWISRTPLDELYTKTDDGCWIWRGSVHVRGQPIYKGWQYPRRFIFERAKGALKPKQMLLGQTCGNKLCVAPDHQIVRERKTFSYYD